MDNFTKALRMAMRLLSSRMYTSREIYDRLRRKGYDDETAEGVVTRLLEEGALDDERYAEFYVADSVNLEKKGEYRIRRELLGKGVAASLVDRTFRKADVDFEAALREFAEERLRVTDISNYKDLERFKAMLARRGYSPDEIRRVLEDYDFDFRPEER